MIELLKYGKYQLFNQQYYKKILYLKYKPKLLIKFIKIIFIYFKKGMLELWGKTVNTQEF